MKAKKLTMSEDWASTLTGGLIILAVILIYTIQIGMPWPSFSWSNADELTDKVFALDNVWHSLIVFASSFAMVVIAGALLGKRWKDNMGFVVLFALTLIAMTLAGNVYMKDWGIETVIFSLLLGLFIRNVFGVPEWIKGALNSEMYVKIGLVLLGTTVLFDKLLQMGFVGILQSVVVVLGVVARPGQQDPRRAVCRPAGAAPALGPLPEIRAGLHGRLAAVLAVYQPGAERPDDRRAEKGAGAVVRPGFHLDRAGNRLPHFRDGLEPQGDRGVPGAQTFNVLFTLGVVLLLGILIGY
ncbi:MAG: hypothetical protein LBU95_02265 [Rikenellaceae bacterium]|jgi:hypothetical protein|nr:hypothetical protein [Rikenellaceae bacterium]